MTSGVAKLPPASALLIGSRCPRQRGECRRLGLPRCGGPFSFGRPTHPRTMEDHISTEPRINDRIHVNEVRLVGPNGEQVGIVRIEDALRLAREADLDLVEVAAQARPPVAKLMDYGKFKYESAQKARESREPGEHRHQGDEAPPEDRRPRLRDQEGSRRALPQGRRQGEDHHHVPRSRAEPPRARLQPAEEAGRGRRRGRHRREPAAPGRPQHADGARPDPQEGRGPCRGRGGQGGAHVAAQGGRRGGVAPARRAPRRGAQAAAQPKKKRGPADNLDPDIDL